MKESLNELISKREQARKDLKKFEDEIKSHPDLKREMRPIAKKFILLKVSSILHQLLFTAGCFYYFIYNPPISFYLFTSMSMFLVVISLGFEFYASKTRNKLYPFSN